MARGAFDTCERLGSALACGLAMLGLAACGAGSRQAAAEAPSTPSTTTVTSPGASPTTTTVTTTTTTTATITATVTLPGAGRPPIIIGDENTPEEFVLGQLYYQALKAQGFAVSLNQNIGPIQVIMQALATGQLAMYPEYLDTWDSDVAGLNRSFLSRSDAYAAGQRYAAAHGLKLLDPTPFSDTDAIAVTFDYAVENDLQAIADLVKVDHKLTLGGPPQFQQDPSGLPELNRAYGVSPAAFKPLDIGGQYQALDQGTVQAAVVNTTDPELLTGSYPLLSDPLDVFGWGNIVPVASVRALDAEGPAFEATINRVSALLTLPQMQEMNAAVELDHQSPAVVAQQFLQSQGLLPQPQPPGSGSSTGS